MAREGFWPRLNVVNCMSHLVSISSLVQPTGRKLAAADVAGRKSSRGLVACWSRWAALALSLKQYCVQCFGFPAHIYSRLLPAQQGQSSSCFIKVFILKATSAAGNNSPIVRDAVMISALLLIVFLNALSCCKNVWKHYWMQQWTLRCVCEEVMNLPEKFICVCQNWSKVGRLLACIKNNYVLRTNDSSDAIA